MKSHSRFHIIGSFLVNFFKRVGWDMPLTFVKRQIQTKLICQSLLYLAQLDVAGRSSILKELLYLERDIETHGNN